MERQQQQQWRLANAAPHVAAAATTASRRLRLQRPGEGRPALSRRFLRMAGRSAHVAAPEETRDYYELLGVGRDASVHQIKSRYRQLQKQYHPDVSGAEGQMLSAEVNLAYETLIDSELRSEYDRRLQKKNGIHNIVNGHPQNTPGLVGPMVEGDILMKEIVSKNVDESSSFQRQGWELLVWIREWAKTFVFASDLPLPMPLQCDDVKHGTRLAFISTSDGSIKSIGELLFLVTPLENKKNNKLQGWGVEVRRAYFGKQKVLAGESRVLKAFRDALRDKKRAESDRQRGPNGFGWELSGFAAAAVSSIGVQYMAPIPTGDDKGASFEMYHLLHDSYESEDEP